jgi:hypothetical protein
VNICSGGLEQFAARSCFLDLSAEFGTRDHPPNVSTPPARSS